MPRFYILIILSFILPSILAFTGVNHVSFDKGLSLSEREKENYWKDATRLAIRHIANGRNFEEMNAMPPKQTVESIYNALVAVHTSTLGEAKEVTSKHKLHTFPIPTVDKFKIIYKKDTPWSKPLKLGEKTTSSSTINAYFKKYGMEIVAHKEWDEQYNVFLVKAFQSFNIASVAKIFSKIEGVAIADLLTPDGEGNDIDIKVNSNGWQLDYLIKFESCITGCQKQHGWSFLVNNAGKVSFQKEYGDPLPVWM